MNLKDFADAMYEDPSMQIPTKTIDVFRYWYGLQQDMYGSIKYPHDKSFQDWKLDLVAWHQFNSRFPTE